MEDNPHGNEDPILEFLGIPFLLWFIVIGSVVVACLAACTDTTTSNPDTIVAAVNACAPYGGLDSYGVDTQFDRGQRIEIVCKSKSNVHILLNVWQSSEHPPAPASAASQ